MGRRLVSFYAGFNSPSLLPCAVRAFRGSVDSQRFTYRAFCLTTPTNVTNTRAYQLPFRHLDALAALLRRHVPAFICSLLLPTAHCLQRVPATARGHWRRARMTLRIPATYQHCLPRRRDGFSGFTPPTTSAHLILAFALLATSPSPILRYWRFFSSPPSFN